MDAGMRLQMALAASRHGYGDARLAARVRETGLEAFVELHTKITDAERERISHEAASLADRGVSAALMGDTSYPRLLSQFRSSPPFLFCLGSAKLLDMPAVGICGARNATDEGIRAAVACGEVAVEDGFTVVSGYARGVDTATHTSALTSGGNTIIVLPEGINHFRVKRSMINVWDSTRTLVVSQFSPTKPWSASSAMIRNSTIIGLSLALVVVEASDKGGTLAAGTKALQVKKPVIALEFSSTPRGNAVLLQRGAVFAADRNQLRTRLRAVVAESGDGQLTMI
jgi:DNA processing protein